MEGKEEAVFMVFHKFGEEIIIFARVGACCRHGNKRY